MIYLHETSLSLPGAEGVVNILSNINLSIDAGQTVAITGASGSGKTSLLMLIGGLESPTSGKITVCGEDLEGKSEDDLARFRAANIGIIFQSFHLMPTMTALENVALPLELAGQPSPRKQAAETLQSLGLGERMGHYPAQLSGGEQQRVAIARAFVTRPKLLLADEPTGNLDQATGTQVMDLLFDLHKQHGTTLVLVTHEDRLAERCKRVIRLRDGKVVA
jgi:putative ABC transport system ATP-binding protein